MSQAIIEFCEGLKHTLLEIEDRLEKAKVELERGAADVQADAKVHVADAARQLEAFKVKAGAMAEALSAEIPEAARPFQERLRDFSQDAQLAMRHAAVFLCETASRSAKGASAVLQAGATRAQSAADELKRASAVVPTAPADQPGSEA